MKSLWSASSLCPEKCIWTCLSTTANHLHAPDFEDLVRSGHSCRLVLKSPCLLPKFPLFLQDDVARVDKLLLEAYGQISEPDSIYAVARSPSLAVQLPLAEHEGSWAEALVGYDLLLHHDALLPGKSFRVQGLQGQHHQQGLFNALQQLSCQHVLQKLFLSPANQTGGVIEPVQSASEHQTLHIIVDFCP